MAQMVARRIGNAEVTGSIPVASLYYIQKALTELVKAFFCTCGAGSFPPCFTKSTYFSHKTNAFPSYDKYIKNGKI